MNALAKPHFIAIPEPISAQEPCGPSLEYDHEFAVLLARMVPRMDAQYGNFVGTAEAPNWPDIERDCKRLLLRSHDINLLVWLCRARTRLGQAAGLARALAAMSRVLHTWPEAVHPQIMLDGHAEPAVRANALAALADPEGLLGDVFDLVVSTNTAMRLTVRDVDRAHAMPPLAEAMSPQSVTLQLGALRAAAAARGAGPGEAPILALAEAAGHVAAIDAWARQQLGEDAPSLAGLSRVLQWFTDPKPGGANAEADRFSATTYDSDDRDTADDAQAEPGDADPLRPRALTTRMDVLANIREARGWYERHEPSSPVAVLLRQAERLVGKRFAEVASCLPLDLLQQWEAQDHSEEDA